MKRFLYGIANWILVQSSPCNQIIYKISEAIDHRLPFSDRVRVRIHKKFCHCCTRYDKHVNSLHRAIKTKMKQLEESTELVEQLPLEASDRIKQQLRHQMGK